MNEFKKARLTLELSQSEFADKLDVSTVLVQKYETEANPGITKKVRKLLKKAKRV